jgi:seryl-tRNA synthetase
MAKQLFLNWEESVTRLRLRGVSDNQLLEIKSKREKINQLIESINRLGQERNLLSQGGKKNAEKVEPVNKEIFLLKKKLDKLKVKLDELISSLPNFPALDVPTNKEGNRVIDTAGYQHSLRHNLTHEFILKKLKIIDEEKSILLSGSKFVVYQGLGSELLHALINFMRKENSERGYLLFDTPYLVKAHNLRNTGQFHKFQDNLYKLEESDFYLLPTAEVSLVNLYQGKILSTKDLPLNLCAYSPCFRAERMAAGQENKGLIRLHQFHKVELVKIVEPENSYQELNKLVTDARNILHLLKIPHRVVELCVGELGFSATKTYDIEVWLPVSKRWLEISSCSNCESFQTERARIRVKKHKQKYSPHSLNGSGLAGLIVALLEYYYDEKENKLILPEVLLKYFF